MKFGEETTFHLDNFIVSTKDSHYYVSGLNIRASRASEVFEGGGLLLCIGAVYDLILISPATMRT